MPPEPLSPWDRREVFKERKRDRFEPSGFNPRWRNSFSGHHGSSRGSSSGGGGSDDSRRSPGHGKQGDWHMLPEENGHGYLPYQYGDKIMEDENFRSSVSQGDGKYGRNGRENRGYKDGKGSWDMNNSSSVSWRLHDVKNVQRLVDNMLTESSAHLTHSDFVNTWHQNHLKDRHDSSETSIVNGLSTNPKGGRENSLDWKPFKWTRSASLSSWSSGFSHSSSSKSLGGVDSNEKAELRPNNATLVLSPTGVAALCGISEALFEETVSRKKQRLGWGEGLAKYEKKKVDVLDMIVNKDGTIISSIDAEPIHSQISNMADKNPRVLGSSDCVSPATPSWVACSSSSGLEEKTSGKAVNVDNDISNLCCSPSVRSQSQLEGFSFNLEKLDTSSVANMGSSLIELLQSDDPSLGDSSFVRSTTLNKLLVWKGDISKALEITESEIDLLENELKSLKFESGSSCPCLAASNFPAEHNAEPCNELGAPSNNVPRPSPLDVAPCLDEIVRVIPDCRDSLEQNYTGGKDDTIASPGTATSKFVEPASIVKAVSSPSIVKQDECPNRLDAVQSANVELKCSVRCSNEEETAVSDSCRDVNASTELKNCLPFFVDVSSHRDGEGIMRKILATNKEFAGQASEVFNKLLSRDQCEIDVLRVTTIPPCLSDALVKEKFDTRKRFLIFKEKIVSLKFKAFQHLWQEDMRLLSMKKFRAKSQKKFELCLRATHSVHQKQCSSICSRFPSLAGHLSLPPTTEILNLTGKLFSVSQPIRYRNALKMPSLILDEKVKIVSRFVSTNGLVEDPLAAEKERALINPWTSEEREIFMDKLARFGKDFQKIASFLDHKTTADCVKFYYKNHKSDCFKKIKMGKQSKSSTNYLVPSRKKWNCKMNAASLDILGVASVMAADTDSTIRSRQMCSGRMFLGSCKDPKISQGHDGFLEKSGNLFLGNEKETVAANVLARICGSVSSEAMGSCITTSVDGGEGYWEQKCQNMVSVMKQPCTTDVIQNVDDETCSDDSCEEMDSLDWTDEEKSLFVEAVLSYGKDFAMISQYVRTRSRDQCKVFFSKARKCLGLDVMPPRHQGTPMSDDVNGSGSDTEGGYAFKTSSVICGDKLGSKTGDELSLHVMDTKQDDSDFEESVVLHTQKGSKVVETLASDACKMEHKPGPVGVGSKILNGFNQLESLQAQRVQIESIHIEAERDQANVNGSSITEETSVHVINPVASDPTAVIKVIDAGASRSNLIQEYGVVRTSDHLPVDMESCLNSGLRVENLHKVSMELNSVGKSVLSLSQQENNVATGNSDSMSHNPAVIHCGKLHDRDGLYRALDFEECRVEQGKKSVTAGDNFQLLSGHPLSNHEGSSEFPCVNPLQIPTKREMNEEIAVPQSLPTSEKNVQLVAKDLHLQKCNCLNVQNLVPEPLKSWKLLGQNGYAALDLEEGKDKWGKISCNDGDNFQHLSGYPLLTHEGQLPTNKETNGDISCRTLSVVQSPSTSERNVQHVAQECRLQKCNCLSVPPFVPEHSVLPKLNEQLRGCSPNLSNMEERGRNGDVKLFGKVLSNSSLQIPNPSSHESDERDAHHPKPCSKSSVLKFSGQSAVDNMALLRFDGNNFHGLENVPVRSYGFWDGNSVQTGYSSLPDSAVLLAKYPAAVCSYHASSSKMEQLALQSAVKGNEHSLNGGSVFPSGEINGSNVVVDYQIYKNHDSSKVQPFAVETKQKVHPFVMVDTKLRQGIFSELQNRNGFEAISGIQQQGRVVMPGMSVVGRGGVLVGELFPGFSDPVPAIERHFSQTDQYGIQKGTIVGEDESWRGSNGNICR